MLDDRYCSNCRAELPKKATACPACGVYAGDIYDGRVPGRRKKIARLVGLLVLLAIAALGWWLLRDREIVWPQREDESARQERREAPKPAGPVSSDGEAVRVVRKYLVATTGIQNDCLALLSNGKQKNDWVLTAVDRCGDLRLGRYRVDARTGAVRR